MKKHALKGLIILGIIVLLCVFFSGTLHTITTAKVQMVKAKTGKMEGEITLTGSLFWPETENIYVDGMNSEDTLILRQLCVKAGSYVKAGDLLAVCSVNDADVRLEMLQESYQAKEKEYYEQERKNQWVTLTPQQEKWYASYCAVRETGNAFREADREYQVEAWREGKKELSDTDINADEFDGDLKAAWEKRKEKAAEYDAAQEEFKKNGIYAPSEDVVTYLEKKAELEGEMKDLTEQISDLLMLEARAEEIRSPHDGYITAADLKQGDSLTRNTVLVQMTKENTSPVIRLDTSESKRNVPAGTEAELSAGENTVKAEVNGRIINEDGKPVIDVKIERKDIASLGGVGAITEANSVTAKIKWKDETATTLIPTSALRGTEGDYYIYIVLNNGEEAGQENNLKTTIARKNVKVLSQSGAVTSVEENLKHETLVYMEDRPLTEGCEVMSYGDV